MPLVKIEIVSNSDTREVPPESVTQSIADELGEVFGSPEAATWLRVKSIPRAQYAENGGVVPTEVQPVFVSITRRHAAVQDLEKEAEAVAKYVAEALDRNREFVHVIYEPDAAGRVAFGGTRWM